MSRESSIPKLKTDHERIVELEDALLTIRGICLGNGPKKKGKALAVINEFVGNALYGDFANAKWVKRAKEGRYI
jgi:hypothetical protein